MDGQSLAGDAVIYTDIESVVADRRTRFDPHRTLIDNLVTCFPGIRGMEAGNRFCIILRNGWRIRTAHVYEHLIASIKPGTSLPGQPDGKHIAADFQRQIDVDC